MNVDILSLTSTAAPVPANIPNKELVKHIEHEFPNMQGPLKVMFERFRKMVEEAPDGLPSSIDCPDCGGTMNVKWDITP